MEISSISKSNVQSSQSDTDEIKTLQNKRQRVQSQIDKLNQEKGGGAAEKQKQVQALQAQIQVIDTQIQQLQQKQAKAKTDSSQQGIGMSLTNLNDPPSQLVRKAIDLEV